MVVKDTNPPAVAGGGLYLEKFFQRVIGGSPHIWGYNISVMGMLVKRL